MKDAFLRLFRVCVLLNVLKKKTFMIPIMSPLSWFMTIVITVQFDYVFYVHVLVADTGGCMKPL